MATPFMDSAGVFRSLENVYRLSMKRTSLFLARIMLSKLWKIGVGTPKVEGLVFRLFGLRRQGDTLEESWFYRRYRTREVRRMLELKMKILENKASKMRSMIRNMKYEAKKMPSSKSYTMRRDFCRIL